MSTAATSATFQINTDQLTTPSQPAPSSGNVGAAIATIRTETEQHRIDAIQSKPQPHHRAVQLDQFANWLKSGDQSSAKQNTTNIVTSVPGVRSDKMLRVDRPQTSAVAQPHFETKHYVEPASSTVELTIEQLKADGRIIGDLQQPNLSNVMPTQQATTTTALNWPIVTTQLVGSPAVLNLEINIQRLLQANNYRISVTSAAAGSGATTIAMTAARQLAAHENRVLLVDANLANSRLVRELNLPTDTSWLEAIGERRSPADLIVKDSGSSVSILPLAPVRSRASWPARILDELGRVIDSIAWDYDAIIFDVGTTNQLVTESSHPGSLADITLLVASNDFEPYVLSLAKSKLSTAGIDNMLIVQNFSRANELSQAKVG